MIIDAANLKNSRGNVIIMPLANKPDQNTRLEWIDLMRAVAIICVVLCHATEAIYSMTVDGIASLAHRSTVYFCFISFTLGRLSVPFFLMITGSLVLTKRYSRDSILSFWKNKWFHLLICTEIWFVIYILFLSCYTHEQVNPLKMIFNLFFIHRIGISHEWYLPMIIGVYLLLPFVANVLHSYDSRLFLFPFIVYSGFILVVPICTAICSALHLEIIPRSLVDVGFSGGNYGLYIVCGYFVKSSVFKKIRSEYLSVISIAAFTATVFLQIWCFKNGYPYAVWYNNLLLFLVSLCLFELASRLKHIPVYKLIRVVSYYSFPIYLIHNIVIQTTVSMFKEHLPIKPVQVICLSAASFVISLIASFAISRIPKFGKYILYLK